MRDRQLVPDAWIDRSNNGEGLYAIALALAYMELEVAKIAVAIERLGNNDAATQMGAIEAFGLHIGEKLDRLTAAIEGLGHEDNSDR